MTNVKLDLEVGGVEFSRLLSRQMHGFHGTIEEICKHIEERFGIDLQNAGIRYGLFATLRCFMTDGILVPAIEQAGGECPVKCVFYFMATYR